MTTDNEWLRTRKTIDAWVRRVFYDPRLNGRDKTTAVALSWYYHQDRTSNRFGTAWPSQKTLAQRTGQSVGQVDKGLSALTDHGYLKKLGKTGLQGTAIRKFTFPATDEDLSWLDSLARPEETGATPSGGADANFLSTEKQFTGESAYSNTPENTYLDTSGTTHNSLDGNSFDLYSLISPSSALIAGFVTPPEEFLDIERQHRDEFINYWIAVSLDDETSYWQVLRSFLYGFSDEHRTDWVGTFKHFMSHLNDERFHGSAFEDGRDYFTDAAHEDYVHRNGYTDEHFQDHWAGVTDGVQDTEYHRAWEHLLVHHSGATILEAAASPLVYKKYPRELIKLLPPEII